MRDSRLARFLRAINRSLRVSPPRTEPLRTRRGGRPWVHGKPNGKGQQTYRSRPGARPESELRAAFMDVSTTKGIA